MAQAPASRTYKIDKLHGANFQPWKLTIRMVLQKLGLQPLIDGSEACPDRQDPTQANAVKAWEERDLNARLELLLHMTDPVKQSVRLLTTAREVWQYLESIYESKSIAYQVNCLKQLVSLTMKEGDVVEMFLQNWRLKLDDLLLAGLHISTDVQSDMAETAKEKASAAGQATQEKAEQAKGGVADVLSRAGDAIKGAMEKVTGSGGGQ